MAYSTEPKEIESPTILLVLNETSGRTCQTACTVVPIQIVVAAYCRIAWKGKEAGTTEPIQLQGNATALVCWEIAIT